MTTTFQVPNIYPSGGPLYWQDEQTGVLPDAVKAYFAQEPLTKEQIEIMREYLRHWINAPCWATEGAEQDFNKLKESVMTLSQTEEIKDWVDACLNLGIDPF